MPEVGQHIGPFTLDKWISSTPQFSLFYASKPEGTRTLGSAAIHILNSDHQSELLLQELSADYNLLRHLDHHSFPKVYHNYISQQAYARQWIDGITLKDLLKAHQEVKLTLDIPTILDIILELAHALKYLHEQQTPITHGRLNLEHVLIDEYGHLYIIGLRSACRENIATYASPEQAASAFIDWRTDQWAIGAILVELLLKEALYTGRQNQQYSAERGDVIHWIRRIETLWPPLTNFLRRVLHPAAGERYKNDSDLIQGLMHIIKQIKGQSQRKIIGTIANDLAKGKLDAPPVMTKIPPVIKTKGTSLASAVLPPTGPKINFEEDLDLTEQIEPLLNAPHIEHPDHTSPQIPIRPVQIDKKPEPDPILHREDKEETQKITIQDPPPPTTNEQHYPAFEEDEFFFYDLAEDSDRTQQIAYGLILINTLSLLYLALKTLL